MAHPKIRKVIVWFTPTLVQYYLTWSPAQKAALQQAFVKAWTNQPSGLPKVPDNLSLNTPTEYPATVLTPEFTWQFYLAHLAQCLALEIGGRLKWSLLSYTTQEASIILDSRECFAFDAYLKGYRPVADKNGYYTPAPPEMILSFLTQIKFLEPVPPSNQPDPERNPAITVIKLPPSPQHNAIVRLFDWCRLNLHHFGGGFTIANMLDHWQYYGYPPIARIIEGTIKSGYPLMHWTAGCTGTVGFLTGILRAVNIPVRHLRIGAHSVPYFIHERAYLSHGDDIYGQYFSGKSKKMPFPSAKLLINQTKFNQWFNPAVFPPDKNIARRPTELAVLYLPLALLTDYCADKAANVSHANGKIFKRLSAFYSLAELEQANLWGRLEARLVELGGCAAIQSLANG
jgi:hypothetical protein